MKKRLVGHIFSNENTNGVTVFEAVEDGMVRYYPVRMKITPGKYRVIIKNGVVVSCWKIRPPVISNRALERALRKLTQLTKDWNL